MFSHAHREEEILPFPFFLRWRNHKMERGEAACERLSYSLSCLNAESAQGVNCAVLTRFHAFIPRGQHARLALSY